MHIAVADLIKTRDQSDYFIDPISYDMKREAKDFNYISVNEKIEKDF